MTPRNGTFRERRMAAGYVPRFMCRWYDDKARAVTVRLRARRYFFTMYGPRTGRYGAGMVSINSLTVAAVANAENAGSQKSFSRFSTTKKGSDLTDNTG